MFKFDIPGRLPDLNDILHMSGTRRGNWSKWGEVKRQEMQRVSACIMRGRRPAKMFTEPVMLEFIFYEPNRKRDCDNVSAGAHKIILDALQETEVIKNDNQRYVRGYADRFHHDPVNPRIEVGIYTLKEWQTKQAREAMRMIENIKPKDTDFE